MLSRSLLSRLGSRRLRRSLVQQCDSLYDSCDIMLSRSLLSKLGSRQLRRSLVQQCAVTFEADEATATIRREADKCDEAKVTISQERKRSDQRDGSEQESSHLVLPSITGLLLGVSGLTVSEDDKRTVLEDDNADQGTSLLSRLAPRAIHAAEKVEDGKGDLNNLKPESRRRQFNFIADLVEETAPGLVYIEIKVGRNSNKRSKCLLSLLHTLI